MRRDTLPRVDVEDAHIRGQIPTGLEEGLTNGTGIQIPIDEKRHISSHCRKLWNGRSFRYHPVASQILDGDLEHLRVSSQL